MKYNDENDYNHIHLTAKDIEICRRELKDIIIAPYDSANAKGTGYNLSLSNMIYSLSRKRLVPIIQNNNSTYFYLKPHDTILALSYEYIKVSSCIAGTFHSRVRMTAKGLGSISTTLDPGWKGMLLFSLNNPTNKKIKVTLSEQTDGVAKRCSVITLIPWRTRNENTEEQYDKDFKLNLDNPPMRIDIWSELASKPLRLFRNKRYQKFCSLVGELSPFYSEISSEMRWTSSLLRLTEELQIAIEAQKNDVMIKKTLIKMQNFNDLPSTVQSCIDELTTVTESKKLLNVCSVNDYKEKIKLANREIKYQILCDQVNQIHKKVDEYVPISWRGNILANMLHFFIENIGVFGATIIIIMILFYGKISGDTDYWIKLLLAFIPLVISIVSHLLYDKK